MNNIYRGLGLDFLRYLNYVWFGLLIKKHRDETYNYVGEGS